MDVLVVGAGDVGRWFGRVLSESAAASVSLTFADADESTARAAAGEFDATTVASPEEARHDLVCFAVPIPAAVGAIERWTPAATAALVDVTGTMRAPIEAMRERAADRERASLHPLFAPANEPGNVAIVADAEGPVTDRVRAALATRGNDLYETTPAEHDEAMRTVQARAHAAILAFGLAAEPVPDELQTPVSTGLADLVAQVTDGEPRVYADIQTAFEGAEDVAEAARELAEADGETFERLFDDAGP